MSFEFYLIIILLILILLYSGNEKENYGFCRDCDNNPYTYRDFTVINPFLSPYSSIGCDTENFTTDINLQNGNSTDEEVCLCGSKKQMDNVYIAEENSNLKQEYDHENFSS